MKKIVKKQSKEKNMLKLEGIYSEGYGIIPKMIMKDRELTLEAKSIYALLCSYAGRGNTAFPSIETQCYYLNISERRYLKHRKLLLDKGYITIERTRDIIEYEDGTKAEVRGKNIYTIVNEPSFLNCQNVSVENVGIQNVSKQNVTLQNVGTNNNSNININNNKNKKNNNNFYLGDWRNYSDDYLNDIGDILSGLK